jgi:hypothetical protein
VGGGMNGWMNVKAVPRNDFSNQNVVSQLKTGPFYNTLKIFVNNN